MKGEDVVAARSHMAPEAWLLARVDTLAGSIEAYVARRWPPGTVIGDPREMRALDAVARLRDALATLNQELARR